MSKWSIFLNQTRYCQSQRGTGNRPCDVGAYCDRCHYDQELQKQFREVEDTIDKDKYCLYCCHELKPHEGNGVCDECNDYQEIEHWEV